MRSFAIEGSNPPIPALCATLVPYKLIQQYVFYKFIVFMFWAFLKGCCKNLLSHMQFQVSLTNRVITSNLVITLPLIICQPRWRPDSVHGSDYCNNPRSAGSRIRSRIRIEIRIRNQVQDQHWDFPFIIIKQSEPILNVGSYCDHRQSPRETAGSRIGVQDQNQHSNYPIWNLNLHSPHWMLGLIVITANPLGKPQGSVSNVETPRAT